MKESEIIKWAQAYHRDAKFLVQGVGDDAAVLDCGPGYQVITTDMLMDRLHFDSLRHSPEQIGHKSLAVNLSDIAAMPARPLAAFLSVALPRHLDHRWWQAFLRGFTRLGDRYDVVLAGGDSNVWDGELVISVTVVGAKEAQCQQHLSAESLKPGDPVLVTGALGGSLYGRHLSFEPRIRESLLINEALKPKALTDVSDGLARDLPKMLRDRDHQLGFDLMAGVLPIHADLKARRPQEDWLRHALCDGEDFELCLIVSKDAVQMSKRQRSGWDFPITVIGQICQRPGISIDGKMIDPSWRGFEHGS